MLDLAVGGSVVGHGDQRRRELLGGWKELKKTAGPPLRLVEDVETAPKEMTKTAGGSELGVAGNGWDYGGKTCCPKETVGLQKWRMALPVL